MGVRDAIVLNTTGSNFEAIQTDDTVRIKGNNTELLSLRDDSGTAILNVDTTNTSVNVTGDITGSVNISGSASTASFGRFDGTLFVGDGSDSTLRATIPRSAGTITGSAQMASDISGSFDEGFNYTGTLIGTQTCGGPGAWSLGASIGFEQSNVGSVAVGQSPNAMLAHYGTGGDVFNGSSWSEITAAPNPTTYGIATGDYDAALLAGGTRSGSQSWNGSSWTQEGSTNRDNTYLASGAGTTEAALIFGGGSGSNDSIGHVSKNTEAYDGSSWSECNDMLIPKYKGSQTGIGSQNSTISYGGCGQAATYNPPSPHSPFAIGDPRQEGTHLEEWDGSAWTYKGDFYAHPQPSFFNHSGAGVGTTNNASFYGGYTHHFGGGGNNSTHYHWDGTAMTNGTSMLIAKSNNDGAGQGGAGGAHSSIFGWYQPGYGGSHPTYGAAAIGLHEIYEPTTTMISTGSFGRIQATSFAGDATDISSSLFIGTNALSSSARIADEISGSFTSGFAFTGTISGSIASSASFGRIEAGFFEGNANFISSSISIGDNIISQSAQIAQDISGSFDEGFEYTGTIAALTIPNAAGGLPGVTTIGASSTSLYSSRNLGMGTSPVAALLVDQCVAEAYDGTTWSNASPATPFSNDNAENEWGSVNDSAFLHSGITYYWPGTSFETKASSHNANNTGFPSAAGAGVTTDAGLKLDNGGKTECYNGSTWSEVNAMPSDATTQYGMSGTSTDAMKAGGYSPGGVQIWGGTNWSEGASLSTSTSYGRLQGTVNTALYGTGYSGDRPGGNCKLEEFNGTSWTTGGNLLLGFYHGMSLGANSKGPGGLFFSGESGYDHPSSADASGCGGPSFTGATSAARLLQIYELPNTVTASFGRLSASTISGDATNISASIFSGTGVVTSSAQLATDISGSFNEGFEFTGTIAASQITVGGTWSVGGAMNNPAQFAAAAGTKNAVVSAGGKNIIYDDASCEAPTEEYNGSTWSNIAAMGDGKGRNRMAGTGTSEAAIFIGGYCDPHYRNRCESEKWNGSSWSEEADLILGRYGGHATGTSEAALFFAGGTPSPSHPKDETEAYDGTSWSECNDLVGSGALFAGSFGASQNSAILAGGLPSSEAHNPYSSPNNTEEWNGTNWSEIADAGQLFYGQAGAGTVNDGQIFAGVFNFPSAPTNDYGVAAPAPSNTQTWDGTAWAQGSRLNVGRRYVGGDGGAQTAIAFGGSSASPSPMGSVNSSTCTEEYTGVTVGTGSFGRLIATTLVGDGTSISSSLFAGSNALSSSAQISSDISGSFTSGFNFSGNISGSSTSTSSFGRLEADFITGDGSDLSAQLFEGTNLVSGSAQLATDISGSFDEGFEYEGTIQTTPAAWSTSDNINVPRNYTRMADASANAALMFGGRLGTNPTSACGQKCTEEYNGTSWSVAGNMNTDRMSHYGFGTQNAAVAAMGISGSLGAAIGSFTNSANTAGGRSAFSCVEEYDGTSWTQVNDIINSTRGAGGFANGTQTAGIVSNGCVSSPSGGPDYDECTFTYNGTNWTQVSCSPIRQYHGGSAGDASGMVMGGSALPHNHPHHSGAPGAYADARAQRYNCAGDAWDTLPNLSVTHNYAFGFGTTNNTYIGGGQNQPMYAPANNVGYHGSIFENFDGTTWSTCTELPTGIGFADAAGLGSGIVAGGCQGPIHPGSSDATAAASHTWSEFATSASFGRIQADKLAGDFSIMRGSVFSHLNAISGAAQIASDISGSFTSGFEYTGMISGSSISTGSFGRIENICRPEQMFYTGDGSNLDLPVIAGAFSSSRQYDVAGSLTGAHISGAFDTGFELFGTTSGSSGRNSHYVGVSGSAFAHAGNATTMSINSLCGSDFEFRLFDTVNQIKGSSYGTGVWSVGNARNGAQSAFAAVGTQNAHLSAGGYVAPKNGTEKYDGTTWSISANMSIENCTAVGFGTQNAAAIAGGYGDYDGTELYNGSTYSDAGNMGKQRRYGASAGTQNAGLVFSGTSPSPASNTDQADTETFDGNTWTEVNNMTVVRSLASSGGTQNSAIIAGGYAHSPGALRSCSEIWNGTNWTAISDMNQGKATGAGIGTQNHFIVAGGNAPSIGARTVNTEEWNGSTWSEVNNLGTARNGLGGAAGGLGSAGIVSGGQIGSSPSVHTNTIELWNATATTTGSFGLITPKGDVKVESFHITGSTFNLPVFTDIQLEYSSSAYENQQNTGSLSGSVDKVAEVIVGQEAGEFYFHSDKNALAYTFASSSLISQSLSFGTFNNISASGNYVSSSNGFFTQSFYSETIVTCYITGSQVGP